MGGSHSLLAMCGSAGRQAFDHDLYRGRARQKKLTREFSNYRRRIVSCRSFITGWRRIMSCHVGINGWGHIMFPFIPQRMKTHEELLLFAEKTRFRNSESHAAQRPREKRKSLSFEWTSTPRYGGLVKRIPKEKTCPREEEQFLILVLSETRHVSFYQRGIGTQ